MTIFVSSLCNLILAALLFLQVRAPEESRRRSARWDRAMSWIILITALITAIGYGILWAL